MEDSQKNQGFELSSVSGVVYVIIDDQRHWHSFKEHVKVWIVLDDGFNSDGKHGDIVKNVELYSNESILRDDNQSSHDFKKADSNMEYSLDLARSKIKSNQYHSNVDVTIVHKHGKKSSEGMKKHGKKFKSQKKLKISMSAPNLASEKCLSTLNSLDQVGEPITRELYSGMSEAFDMSGHKDIQTEKPGMKKHVYCEYCCSYFNTKQEFYNHKKSKREEHKCDICQRVLPFKAHLLVHVQSHKNTADNSEGSSENKNTGNLQQTTSSDTLKTNCRCEFCGATMSNSVTFKTHMMQHTGENAYQCCVCSKKFNSIGGFSYHMTTHRRVGKVLCKTCNTWFDSRIDLCKHQLTHKYKCSICNTVFPNKTSRNFHYKTSHVHDILKCPQCDKMYSSNSELQLHMKYHKNRRKTQCTVCGRFVSRLSDHMLSHLDQKIDEAPHVCDQCPKQFKNTISFQRHLRTHLEEKPYLCTQCPKSFGRSTSLRRHLITHTQEKPYVCSVCGKACAQLCNLKTHMLIHKESSGCKFCSVCSAEFSDLTSLQAHIKNAHA